jgi:hypothetical protein
MEPSGDTMNEYIGVVVYSCLNYSLFVPMKIHELSFRMRKKRNAKERRRFPRIPALEIVPQSAVVLAMGQKVELVNFNLNGAFLIRSEFALVPSSPVQMRLEVPGVCMNIGGRVHRCRVIGIGMRATQYEAAIVLEEKLPLPLFSKIRKMVFDRSTATSLFLKSFHLDKTA